MTSAGERTLEGGPAAPAPTPKLSSWLWGGVGPGPTSLRLGGALVAVAAVARLGAWLNPLVDEDEAWYHAFAQLWLAGGRPYTDAVDLKPPLLYGWYAAVTAVSPSMLWVHLVTLAWVVGTALLLRAALCPREGASERELRAGWLAAFAYVLFSASLWPKTSATNGEILMNLPVALALLLAARFRESRRTALLFASGLAVGLAALFKYQAGVVAPAMLLFALAGGREEPDWTRRLVPRAIAFGVGLGTPAAACLGLAWLFYAPADVVFWAWQFNFLFMAGLSRGYFVSELAIVSGQVLGSWILLWAAAVTCALRAWRERRAAGLEACLLGALVLSGVGVSAGGKFFAHYFLQLLPFLAGLAGLMLARPAPTRGRARLRVLGVALPLVLSLVYGGLELARNLREGGRARAVAAAVVRHCGPTDRVLVWGRFPEVHYFADRLPASRFFASNFVVGMTSYSYEKPLDPVATRAAWDRFGPLFMADLARRPPAVIVDTSTANLRDFAKYPLASFPELVAFMRAGDYVEVETVAGMVVYARRGAPPE